MRRDDEDATAMLYNIIEPKPSCKSLASFFLVHTLFYIEPSSNILYNREKGTLQPFPPLSLLLLQAWLYMRNYTLSYSAL